MSLVFVARTLTHVTLSGCPTPPSFILHFLLALFVTIIEKSKALVFKLRLILILIAQPTLFFFNMVALNQKREH